MEVVALEEQWVIFEHSLGYVNGICGRGPSPILALIGGTVT